VSDEVELLCTGALRRPLLCTRRHGEPYQRAAAMPLCRPNELCHVFRQSPAFVVFRGRVRTPDRTPTCRSQRHRVGARSMWDDPKQAPQDRRPGLIERTSSLGALRWWIPLSEAIRPSLRKPTKGVPNRLRLNAPAASTTHQSAAIRDRSVPCPQKNQQSGPQSGKYDASSGYCDTIFLGPPVWLLSKPVSHSRSPVVRYAG
jgi:hypothetical protein